MKLLPTQNIRNLYENNYILLKNGKMSNKSLLLLLFVVLTSCEKKYDSIDTFRVEYSKISAWVGYSYSIIIDNSGFLDVTEVNSIMDYYRESTFKLLINDLELVEKEIQQIADIDVMQKYGFGDDKPYDLPVTRLLYNTNLNSDSTLIYYPEENELPNELVSFLNTIQQIILETDTLRN